MRYSEAFQAKQSLRPSATSLGIPVYAAAAAHVALYASNVALRSLKFLNPKSHMLGLGAAPIGGPQPFGRVCPLKGA